MWKALNYFECFLILVSAVSGFVSISAFASLVGLPVDITSSAVGLNICAITVEVKKDKPYQEKEKNPWWNNAGSKKQTKCYQIFDF